MGKEEAKVYRGLAARLNYFALDRTNIQCETKEVAKYMAKPSQGTPATQPLADLMRWDVASVVGFFPREEAGCGPISSVALSSQTSLVSYRGCVVVGRSSVRLHAILP